MKKILCVLALGSSLMSVGVQASPWSFKAGLGQVRPNTSHDTLNLEVSDEVNLTGSIEYDLMPNLSAEVLLAVPFKHDVTLNGQKAATFRHLPPTVSLKYSLPPMSGFTPYAGLGVNYTFVFDEKTTGALTGAKLKGDDSVGLAALLGVSYQYANSPWSAALDVRYIDIQSDLTVNGASSGTLEVKPTVLSLSAQYRY